MFVFNRACESPLHATYPALPLPLIRPNRLPRRQPYLRDEAVAGSSSSISRASAVLNNSSSSTASQQTHARPTVLTSARFGLRLCTRSARSVVEVVADMLEQVIDLEVTQGKVVLAAHFPLIGPDLFDPDDTDYDRLPPGVFSLDAEGEQGAGLEAAVQ